MMLESGLPLRFWFLACSAAVFLSNRTLTKAVDNHRTPFKLWHFRKPSVDHLRVFGCQSFRLIRKELRDSKFSPVTSEGVLVGYDQDNFNYLIYDLSERKIRISHDVKFKEDHFPFINIEENSNRPDNQRVRVQYFDDDEDQDRVDEVTPHTNPVTPETGLEVVVDELTTHTDSRNPDPAASDSPVHPSEDLNTTGG